MGFIILTQCAFAHCVRTHQLAKPFTVWFRFVTETEVSSKSVQSLNANKEAENINVRAIRRDNENKTP